MQANVVIDRLLLSGMTDASAIADVASRLSFTRVDAARVNARSEQHAAWREQVLRLAALPQPAQRSEEWHNTRWNLITASDIAQALGEGKFGTQKEFLAKKSDPEAAASFNGDAPPLVWGVKYEPVANALYEYRTRQKVLEFGLLKHPSLDFIGASPDGITEFGIMLEIKCPWRRKITGEIPRQYFYQIQAQLDVCGLDECDYLEVSLCEYPDEQAFLADGADTTKDGLEKGIVVEYAEDGRRSYEYCDVGAPVTELLEWRDSVLACRPGGKVTYWCVDQFSVARVTRDEYFVAQMYAKAREVWDKVLALRRDPVARSAERAPAKKRISSSKVSACPLPSDEDD